MICTPPQADLLLRRAEPKTNRSHRPRTHPRRLSLKNGWIGHKVLARFGAVAVEVVASEEADEEEVGFVR